MILFSFYRAYCAIALGILSYFLLYPSIWLSIGSAIVVRAGWYCIERIIDAWRTNRWFERHQAAFKDLCGPYGIRLVNKAESERRVRNSLAEVFTPSIRDLREKVKGLEALDVFFQAGMRPDGDEWQLHDLALKYARHRLEKEAGGGSK